MKTLLFASFIALLAFAGGFAIAKSQPSSNTSALFTCFQSEMPGATGRSHPDTCIVWMDDNLHRYIELAQDRRIPDSLLKADIKAGKVNRVN